MEKLLTLNQAMNAIALGWKYNEN